MIQQRTKYLASIALFVIAAVFGIHVFLFTQSYLADEALRRWKEEINDVRNELSAETGLSGYIRKLEEIRLLFAASKSVERSEWTSFIGSASPSLRSAEVNSFAYVKRVTEKDRAAFVRAVQTDTSTNKRGYPHFAILPEGVRSEYYVTTYIEPEAGNEPQLGIDLFNDPKTRNAIEKARDTGALTVVSLTENDMHFVTVYLPIYRNTTPHETIEERRNAIEGVVSTRVNLNKLFAVIDAKDPDVLKNLRVTMFGAPSNAQDFEKNIIFRFAQNAAIATTQEAMFTENIPLALDGTHWTLRIEEPARNRIGFAEQYFPAIASTGTALIFVLIGGIFLTLQSSKKTALAITEDLRKKLTETEQRLVETAPDPILILDKAGRIISANALSIKIFGYPIDEIRHKHFTEIGALTEESTERATHEFKEIISGVTRKPFELKINRRQGGIVYAEANVSSIREHNTITGAQVIFRDITERKLHERELAERLIDLQKFKSAVESASDHVVITDTDGIVQYANKAAETITGYAISEIVGQKAGKIWGGLMPQDFYKELWETIKTRKHTFKGEMHNRRKSGEEYIALVEISPILDETGNIRFFVAIERDITEEKKIDRAKTEFVSLASHQLRTPLTTINWYAEMLLNGDAGEVTQKQKTFVEEIYNGGRRLVRLVNSLLNVSRVELGTFVIQPELLDPSAICTVVLKDIAQLASFKHIAITTTIADDIPRINADAGLLQIVFQNIITNAVEYTKENGTIAITLKKQGDDFLFSVADNGVGIPAANQDKIFGKMYRADNARDIKTYGTGLGLYIVKSILNEVKGKIWFESVENKGTTFYVTIPLSGMEPKKGTKMLSVISEVI